MSGSPPPARTASRLVVLALAVLAGPAALLTAPAAPSSALPRIAVTGATTWTRVTAHVSAEHARTVHPRDFSAYAVDRGRLLAALDSGLVEVPDPDGDLVAFRVEPTSVLEDALAASHPELRTWAGRAVDGSASIRLDSTPEGVHASVRGDGAAWYVDPAYRDGGSLHLSYDGADLPEPEHGLVEPELPRRTVQRVASEAQSEAQSVAASSGSTASLRTYRIALLSDPAYAAYVLPGAVSNAASDDAVLAAKTTLVNRLDQVYGDDLGIRLVLANGTDSKLNLWTAAEATGANGPCGLSPCFPTPLLAAGCSAPLIDRQQWVIGQLVGARNYDVGHLVLRTSGSGGGIAYVGVAGLDAKASGCTGLAAPSGDAYTIDYLAHELGHQLGADHTFDGTDGSCGLTNQRWVGSAVEPGSGSTIMGYAGVCGADDLQAHSDPVFSTVSQEAVNAYVTGGPWAIKEVQSVAFTGFDGADAFSLTIPGRGTTPTVTRGAATYTQTRVRDAVLAVLPAGSVVSVTPFFGENGLDDRGFTISYTLVGGTFYPDVAEPTVNQVAGSFSAAVNDISVGNAQTTANGGAVTPTTNHHPTVDAGADRTIPVRTPFVLTGTGSDSDGDALGYLWEQLDTTGSDTGTTLATQPRTAGPLFRVFGTASSDFAHAPTGADRSRSFPDLAQVVAGNTNAETGSCPAGASQVDCLSEWLPTTAYTGTALHFRLSARDGSPQGGGTASDDVVLTLDKTRGPFRVLSQATAAPLQAGSAVPVTWTTGTLALAASVRITLSTDGGLTFPDVLAAATPNDGSETVTLPMVSSAAARIRVEAVDNYFYDVNDASFVITNPGGTAPLVVDRASVPTTWTVQLSDPTSASFSATSGQGAGALSATASLPAGLGLSARTVTSSTAASWSITGKPTAPPGSYPVQVGVTDGSATQTFDLTVVVAPEDSTVAYTGPTRVVGADPDADQVPVTLTAQVTQAADGSPGALDAATVTFTDTIGDEDLCTSAVTSAGTAGCTFAADLSAHSAVSYHVALVVGGSFRGTSTSDATLVVELPDVPPPDTTITSGPSGWLMAASATFGLRSSAPDATYGCRLDAVRVPCEGGSATVAGLSAGTHRFTAAAVDDAGETDDTPAVRDFAVPVDDAGLGATGRWKRKRSSTAYLGTYSQARKKAAALTFQVRDARELVLLVQTGKRYGAVKVFLGGGLLATARTAGPAGARAVRIGHFSAPRSGTLRIVSTSWRTVRIDALGVSTAAF